MTRRLLLITGWMIWAWTTPAQQSFMTPGSAAYRIMHQMQDFDYAGARQSLSREKSGMVPAEYAFLQVNYYWWMMVSDPHQPAWRDSLVQAMDRVDSLLPHTITGTRDYYIRLMNFGYRYRLAFKEDRFVDGLRYAHKTATRIRYALDHARESPFLKLTAAIYLFSTGYGEKEYWYLKPYFLLIPRGDMQKGLAYLDELTKNDNPVLATESAYVAARIYKDMLGNYHRTARLLENLVDRHPHNLFYRAMLIRTKKALGLPTGEDEQTYRQYWAQTSFVTPGQKKFYARWQNIP